MKKKVEKKILKLRLPAEAVEVLRKKGGIHRAKKGPGSYDRKRSKKLPIDLAKSVGFYF